MRSPRNHGATIKTASFRQPGTRPQSGALSFYIEPDIIPTFPPAFVGQWRVFVRKRRKVSFDPKIFLAQVGEGKTIAKYRRGDNLISEGEHDASGFDCRKNK